MLAVGCGAKRSGTSIMMRIIKELGIPIHYDEDDDDYYRNYHGGHNEHYFEDRKMSINGVSTEEAKKLK